MARGNDFSHIVGLLIVSIIFLGVLIIFDWAIRTFFVPV